MLHLEHNECARVQWDSAVALTYVNGISTRGISKAQWSNKANNPWHGYI